MTSVTALAATPVVNGLRNRAGSGAAVAGDVVDLTGTDLAAMSVDATGWPLPFALGGTQVLCGQLSAALLSVAPDRVRIQLPIELSGLDSVSITVVNAAGSSAPFSVPLTAFAPAILSLDRQSVVAGQTLTLRAVGLGPRFNGPASGASPSNAQAGKTYTPLLVTVGGLPAPISANALAAEDPQSDTGVQIVRVTVPVNVAATANAPVQLRIGDASSAAMTIAVTAPALQITINPPSASVPFGGSQTFSASVQGSNDTAVRWSIDNLANAAATSGYASGYFFGSRYSADANFMPSPNWVVVRATHSSGAFATALVQTTAPGGKSYRIVPDMPMISAGESVTLRLVDADGNDVAVTRWSYEDGTRPTPANRYTAPINWPPTQVNVTAYLAGTPYQVAAASTTISIQPARLQISGTTPSVGHIGEPIAFQGTGVNSRSMSALFTSADGGLISVGSNSNGAIIVPHGAASGPVYLLTSPNSGVAPFRSAPYALTILPRLRLHAARQRISSGESVQITATAPNMPGQWTPIWHADLGSIDGNGVFTAPVVAITSYARVQACLLPSSECATTVVAIDPLRLATEPLTLNPGETTQLKAWQGAGEVAVNWTAVTSNLSVTPSGQLTAGTGAFDGGLGIVEAQMGAAVQRLNVSIRGIGTAANAPEFNDYLGYGDNNSVWSQVTLGTFPYAVAVYGNWIYTLARSLDHNYGGPNLSIWLDAYQIDEHGAPVWQGSFEAPYADAIWGSALVLDGADLYAVGDEQAGSKLMLRFNVGGSCAPGAPAGPATLPQLCERRSFNGDESAYRHSGYGVKVLTTTSSSSPWQLQITDYAASSTRTLPMDFTPISYSGFSVSASGGPQWAAVTICYSGVSGEPCETDVFDVTGTTAKPIAYLANDTWATGTPIVMQDLLITGGDVYQVADGTVTWMSSTGPGSVSDVDPASKRILIAPGWGQVTTIGSYIVDLSDPLNPRRSAPIQHAWRQWAVSPAKLGTNFIAYAGGPDKVSVAPIDWRPGIWQRDAFPATPWTNDVRVRDGYAFWTGPGWGVRGRSVSQAIFEVDSVASYPSTLVATMDRPGDHIGWAIELIGNYAYVGTDSELIVYDITNPAAPIQHTVISAPAVSFALLGNRLYVGSSSAGTGRLLVYDVTDPGNPRLANILATAGNPYSVAAQPGWLALALGKRGFAIYSLANADAPVRVSEVPLPAWGVAGHAGTLYVAGDISGLLVYDLADLKNPRPLSYFALSGGAVDSGVRSPTAISVSYDSRGIVWVGTEGDTGTFYGIDVRSPARPRHLVQIVTGNQTEYSSGAAYATNGELFLAGNTGVFDVSTPQNIGLQEVAQTTPWSVLPTRSNGHATAVHLASETEPPLKARYLGGTPPTDQRETTAATPATRAFRAERPAPRGPKMRPVLR